VANAEELPLRDRAAAVTWTSLLLHHFTSLDRLGEELRRVTRRRLIAFEPNAGNFVTWFAMSVVNRVVGLQGMTRNQRALWPGWLTRRFRRWGFERRALHFMHRPWQDRLSVVRRLYTTITAWLPVRMRANKFLVVFEKRTA
jgi:SAM-dependent methyltransferase